MVAVHQQKKPENDLLMSDGKLWTTTFYYSYLKNKIYIYSGFEKLYLSNIAI